MKVVRLRISNKNVGPEGIEPAPGVYKTPALPLSYGPAEDYSKVEKVCNSLQSRSLRDFRLHNRHVSSKFQTR